MNYLLKLNIIDMISTWKHKNYEFIGGYGYVSYTNLNKQIYLYVYSSIGSEQRF